MENSENNQSFLKNNVQSNENFHINSEARVTFQSSMIIPPRSYLTKSIKKPIKQTNDYRKPASHHMINSARISKPISYDIPLIPIVDHYGETNNLTSIKNKKSYVKNRRPLSARSFNVTLDSLLNSVEEEISTSKSLRKTTTNNFRFDRNPSSRSSKNVNHYSLFNSKIKVQKPLSPRAYRSETEKSTLSSNYNLNRKYPK